MPLITPSTDSLPYIDRPPSPSSLAAASALISSATSPTSTPHPSLPPAPSPISTPLLAPSFALLASGATSIIPSDSGVEMSRYSSLPTFPTPSPNTTTTLSSNNDKDAQTAALRQAIINAEYLRLRNQALGLLDKYGKNAWLLGNSQLEDILRDEERMLVQTREMVEGVNRERKAAQEGRRAELEGGEEAWREGVRGRVEVEVALGELRR